ncbi:MAG TPA: signal recognition particle-docking protein FtsY, partial [Rhodanobacter sp.]|nr:signal recognition particle-docking protein FtsY [Rhodanobacter sp.]
MLSFWKKKPAEPPASAAPQDAAPAPSPVTPAARRGWRERLAGSALGRGLGALFQHNPKLDDDLLDELETALITA